MRTAESVLLTLAAGAGARAHRIDADVLRANIDVDVLGLGQHGDGRRRRGCGRPRRNALHAMYAGFVFQARKHAFAADRGNDLLVAAEVVLGDGDDLPAADLGVAAVHAEEVGGEGAASSPPVPAHLEDRAALVGGILRQELYLELLLELLSPRLQRLEIGARHLDHFFVGSRVGDQCLEIGLLLLGGRSASMVATTGLRAANSLVSLA